MERVELLTVEASFSIRDRGVIVIPDFSVPDGWKNRTEMVTVTKPDGLHYEASAQLYMAHFNLTDPYAPIDKRYRVVVMLLGWQKEDLPIGSKIMVSQAVRDAVLPKEST